MRRRNGQAGSRDTVRQALEAWRRSGGGRGRKIPGELWASAAEIARTEGVGKAARWLRLDSRKLAELVGSRSSLPAAASSHAFVELGGVELREPEPRMLTIA